MNRHTKGFDTRLPVLTLRKRQHARSRAGATQGREHVVQLSLRASLSQSPGEECDSDLRQLTHRVNAEAPTPG